jgi:hypothetical protein
MKLVRILAIVPLALISLLNVGYFFGTEPKPALWLAVAVLVLGVAGFVAAFGLARNTTWCIPAALAVAAVNIIGAIVALVSESEGAIIGLALSSLALLLVVLAGARRPKVSPA